MIAYIPFWAIKEVMCYLLRVFQNPARLTRNRFGRFCTQDFSLSYYKNVSSVSLYWEFSFFVFILIRESFNCGWTFFPSRMAHHPMQSTWNQGSQSSKMVFLMWPSFNMRWCFRLAMFPIVSRFLQLRIFPCRAFLLQRGRMCNSVAGLAPFQTLRKENRE